MTPDHAPLGTTPSTSPTTSVHLLSLLAALAIMIGGTVYPLVFADHNGKADHTLAFTLFWAMSAGLVRGVGFIPQHRLWKMLFSGWACFVGCGIAAWLRWGY